MSRSIRDTTTLREVSERVIRDAGNTPRTISETWVRGPDNVLRQVWGGASGGGMSPMTANASPTSAFGAISQHAPATITTNAVAVQVDGGKAPYAYSWQSQEGTLFPVAATSASTAFRGTGVSPGDSISDEFICTVTDAAGQTAQTPPISAAVSNYGN